MSLIFENSQVNAKNVAWSALQIQTEAATEQTIPIANNIHNQNHILSGNFYNVCESKNQSSLKFLNSII